MSVCDTVSHVATIVSVTTVITTIVISTILGYRHNVFTTVVLKTVTNPAQGHCIEGTLIGCLHFAVRCCPSSSVITLATNLFSILQSLRVCDDWLFALRWGALELLCYDQHCVFCLWNQPEFVQQHPPRTTGGCTPFLVTGHAVNCPR